MFFASDNAAGLAPGLLAAIEKVAHGFAPSYGDDLVTKSLKERLSDFFAREVEFFFVATGTAANAIAISHFCPPGTAVLCHERAHINAHECSSPEFFTNGAKLITFAGENGLINVASVEKALQRWQLRDVHVTQPRVMSISNCSELGGIYHPRAISELTAMAKKHGMAVHMDGARFANAVAGLGCHPADITWRAGVDVLSLGFTKNGALEAEAIIFFNPEQASGFAYRHKQAGQLASKCRFIAAQFMYMLSDNNWLKLARSANDLASKLTHELQQIKSIKVVNKVEANIIYVLMPVAVRQALASAGARFFVENHNWLTGEMASDDELTLARFVTSFANTAADIDAVISVIANSR